MIDVNLVLVEQQILLKYLFVCVFNNFVEIESYGWEQYLNVEILIFFSYVNIIYWKNIFCI